MNKNEPMQPRKGYIMAAGVEMYDIKEHVRRAFEGMPIGGFLYPDEIRTRGQRDDIVGSESVLVVHVERAMKRALVNRQSIRDVVVDISPSGRLIGYAKNKLGDPGVRPVEPPQVKLTPCCEKEDDSECFCSPAKVYIGQAREALRAMPMDAAKTEQEASSLADHLIGFAGYNESDPDVHGDRSDDVVRDLLIAAFMRQPGLIASINQVFMRDEN